MSISRILLIYKALLLSKAL